MTESRAETALSEAELGRIHAILDAVAGHQVRAYKSSTLGRRVRQRQALSNCESLPEYLELLARDGDEARRLAQELLIGVTGFFRDGEAFELLPSRVLPELGSRESLRIWVPACASGEEAYSIAMLLDRHFSLAGEARPWQIFATDLDPAAIRSASQGRYRADAPGLPPELAEIYFEPEGEMIQVRPSLRDRIVFAVHDLLQDPPFTQMDLLSCRNLMIYLRPEFQARLHQIFAYALRPGGWLLLGPSETLPEQAGFVERERSWKLYQRLELPQEARPSLPAANPRGRSALWEPQLERRQLAEQVQQQLLLSYVPRGLVFRENFELVHLSGMEPYLRLPSGAATLNVLDMLPPAWSVPLSLGVSCLLADSAQPVQLTEVIPGPDQRLSLQLELLSLPGSRERLIHARVLEATPAPLPARALDFSHESQERLQLLEQELRRHKEHLQLTIEELSVANAELQAANEELQSTNEELQTVNGDYHQKLDELGAAHDDLHNLLQSTEIATLFLDEQLRIRRFTQAIHRIVPLLPQDLGRPIQHFHSPLLPPELVAELEQVALSHLPAERRLSDGQGRSYMLRMHPFRSQQAVYRGVVMTFVEISQLLQTQQALDASRARMEAVFTSSQEALMLLDRELRVMAFNPGIEAWTRNAELAPVQLGHSILEVLPVPLREIFAREMRTVLDDGQAVEVERVFENARGESYWYVVTRSPVREADGSISGICVSARDISDRKQAEIELSRSHRRLERARDLAQLGYWDLDPALGLLSCSAQVCAIFELPPQPAYRFEDLMARVHPDDRAGLQDAWAAAVRDGSPLSLTHRLLLPGQRQRVVRQLAQLGDEGLLEGAVQDLTAWYETEQELELFFDMTPDLLCRVSRDGRLTKLNRTWEAVLGIPREELLARPFFDFVHPDDLASSQAVFAEMLKGVPVTDFENRYRCADGSWRSFSWTSTGLTPAGIIYCTARDVTERKRSEEAIRLSEANLQAIFENVHDSLLLLDRDFCIVAFNEKAVAWSVLQEQAPLLRGRSLVDSAPPERRERFMQQLGLVLAGESFEYETAYQNSLGRETWYLVSLSPVREADGGVSGVCVSGRDITERKQAELTLSQLNERLQKAKDVARLGYWDYDPVLGQLLCSPKSCRILGLDPEAGPHRFEELLACVHPDDRDRFSLAWDQALGGVPLQLVHRLLLPEGEIRHLRQLAQLGSDGASLAGTVQDISEWYQTEQELSQLFELSTDLICICDFDGRFRKLNPAFASVLGYREAEIRAQTFLDLVHREDLPAARKEFQKLRRGQGSLQVENRTRCADGEYRWIAWKATALADTGLVYCSGRDISERKQAEAQLAEYADRLTLILESITDAFVTLDSEGRFTYANQAAVRLLQMDEDKLVGRSLWALFPASEGPLFADRYRWALIYQEPVHFEVHNQGLGAWLEVSVYPSEESFSVFFRDITEIKLSRSVTELERETLARYAAGREALPDLLGAMLSGVEALLPGARCLVQVPQGDKFQVLAAPTLPPALCEALVGQPIAAGLGSCAAAALQRKPVLAPDMQTDPHWQGLRAAVEACGLRACWSYPVLSTEQELLATFACFFAAPHRPRLPETLLAERVSKLLAVILENQHSNAALHEVNRRYELIARATNDAVWDWDLRDDSVIWNQAISSVFGHQRAGATADWWSERIHPEDREGVLASLHTHIDQALLPNWQAEYRFRRGDGSYCQVLDRGYLLLDAQGQPLRMLGAMQDISGLKRAEELIRANEAHLLASQRIAHIGSWEVRLDQAETLEAAPVTWSEECYRIFGYAPGAVTPSVPLVLASTHPDDLPRLQAAIGHTLATGELYSIEHRIRRPDGSEALIYQRAELLRDSEGRPQRVIGTVREVSAESA